MDSKYDVLFTPMKIGKLEIKNRIVMVAMGGAGFLIDGDAFNVTFADYLIERARCGTGLIIPGAEMVQSMYGQGEWFHDKKEAFVAPMKQMMEKIHSYDSKLFLQLSAGVGRELVITPAMFQKVGPFANFDLEKAMVAPSDKVPNVWMPDKGHRELAKDEIKEIIDAFVKCAVMAKEADVDGIEIHAVHEGYLLDQFTMEVTNQRTDEYGGSLENRMRFVCEIIKGIKEACGEDYPVMVRYSVASKMKGFNSGAVPGEAFKEAGRSLEESPKVAQLLEMAGCDALDTDNGCYDAWYWAHPPMYMPMACNLPESAFLKYYVNIPIICSGRMEDPDLAAQIIKDGVIDGIGLGRQLLADPEWPDKVQRGDVEDIRPCIACHNGCFGRVMSGKDLGCALNPSVMHEKEFKIIPAEARKKIIVIGGGIGGMEFARVSDLRGHDVTLYEKTEELGGAFIAAAAPEFKEADKKLIDWYRKQMKDSNVKIIYNTEVTTELINQCKPDAVIIATGAKPRMLNVSGPKENVIEAIEYLRGQKTVGDNVAVIGGGLTGCEIAFDLAKKGKNVKIIEMLDDILKVPGLCTVNSNLLRDLLIYYKVEILNNAKLLEFTSNGIKVEVTGKEQNIAVDSVIVAAGYIPCETLEDSISDKYENYVVGDASGVGNLLNVIWKAYEIALNI